MPRSAHHADTVLEWVPDTALVWVPDTALVWVPDIEVDVVSVPNCEVVCGSEYANAMREGALPAHILLKGCLHEGSPEGVGEWAVKQHSASLSATRCWLTEAALLQLTSRSKRALITRPL